MSLTSRVTNLFSASANTQQARDELNLVDNGLSGGKQAFSDVVTGREGLKLKSMASVGLEDEGRPPYLHVRTHFHLHGQILIRIVHDCWRFRRYDWRSSNALFRHCKDKTARRSTCSSEVHNDVELVLNYTTTGRNKTRIIRRMGTGAPRVISWHHHFLRDV